ncbi:hypothetical protein GGS21DRAFT_488709 [Xylaria nigripes]|nr:hypothetical protein GGS21DRAFT_488709 [Xylaria nigripes]
MTLLAWSLILASTVYIAFQRRTLIETLLAFWRPPPATGQSPPTLSISTDAETPTKKTSDRPSTSAVSAINQDAPMRRVKTEVEAATDRSPIPKLPPSTQLEPAIDAPTETDTPVVAIISSPSPSPETTLEANRATKSANENDIPSFSLSPPISIAEPPAPAAAVARAAAIAPAATASLSPSPSTPATASAKSPAMSMPPPPRPPKLNQLPKNGNGNSSSLLAAPTTRPSPLPNRGPQQPQYDRQPGTSTLAPPPTHSSKPAKPSRKVTLEPGHSPLDWARLANHPTADLRGLGPGASYLRVTPSMLKRQTGRRGKDAWTALGNRVYNITPYLPFHPGGEPELLRAAGRDGTKLFGEIHPWVNYETMLSSCLIGLLVEESEAQSSGDMEAMD